MRLFNLLIISFSLTILLALVPVEANAFNAGSLDTSFGSGGIVTTQLNGLLAWSSDMTIQPDNKLIVASRGSRIARFNQNGTLDTTFDGDGIADVSPCQPEAVQLSSDGKIVFGGSYSVSNTGHICVGRLNSNGTLDTTFDTDGIAQTTMGIESVASSINVLTDGKILAGGWTSLQDFSNRDYAMVKYNANGSLDTTFGTGGRVASELGSNEFSYDSEIQSDGKIILVGDYTDNLSSQTMAAIVRFNNNGTLDTSFGNNGKVFRLTAQNGEADEVNIQPDGKLIISGNGLVPARYTSNGTLDTEFNSPAWITTSASAIQPDGKILVLGATMPGSQFLVRYNNNGTLDNSFGVGGIVMNTGELSQPAFKILIAPDRKIVLMGTRTSTGNGFFEIVLLRYLNNRPPFMDFDGDSKTDVSIFRPSNGQWWFLRSSDGGNYALQFGVSTDKIVPADYTGDGKTDFAFFRPSSGQWFILRSEDFSFYAFPFGTGTDIPVPADFDGDGKADAAVFRPSTATWYIQKSSGGTTIQQFGANGDAPVPADYDGDGKADIAIFRPNGANGAEWWINKSSDNQVFAAQFGAPTDKAVQGDYTGDGKSDIAVWRPLTGEWFVLRSEDFSYYSFPFGTSDDIPVAGDYDGDGRADAAVFRSSNSMWYAQRTTAEILIQAFGIAGDLPVPNAFVN